MINKESRNLLPLITYKYKIIKGTLSFLKSLEKNINEQNIHKKMLKRKEKLFVINFSSSQRGYYLDKLLYTKFCKIILHQKI